MNKNRRLHNIAICHTNILETKTSGLNQVLFKIYQQTMTAADLLSYLSGYYIIQFEKNQTIDIGVS